MRFLGVLLPLFALLLAGCGRETPTQPKSTSMTQQAVQRLQAALPTAGQAASKGPGYEPAYVDDRTVTISAIEVPNKVPMQAQADLYEVVYPPNWASLGIAAPQCNPCDHEGNGIDFTDYHDHILDSAPPSGGDKGEFSPLWHVWVIIPNLNNDSAHNQAVTSAYVSMLPIKSEAGVDALLGMTDSNGAPLAIPVDTHFYFLCAVVNQAAAK